jgi:hypothetical protein
VTALRKGRGVRELWDRGRQAAVGWIERAGWSRDAREPDVDTFARWLSPGTPRDDEGLRAAALASLGGLVPGLAHTAAAAAEVLSRWPGDAAELIRRGRQALDGRFDLLGYRDLDFHNPIDWHLDPVSGTRAPLIPAGRVAYLDPSKVGDHKVVWELNRHQHLVTLAQAWRLSGDQRFLGGLAAQLEAWMDANPPKLGINWASSLEVAFRGIAWLYVLALAGEALPPLLIRRMLGNLHVHARHLEHNLSTWFSPNTHLTGEALGLVYLGQGLPCFAAAPRWRALGLEILQREATRQVRADGVYFEQSTYYHRYTTDFYAHLALLLEAAGTVRPEWLEDVLGRLHTHLSALRRPDGSWPLIGDEDAGRLLCLKTRRSDDFRDTAALGAALLGRADACPPEETPSELAWLLGAEGLRAPTQECARTESALFPEGGFAVLRDDAGNWMLYEAGPHGALSGGHAHADALAIELAAYGQTLVADAGTGSYVADRSLRDRLRDGNAHGTVTVEGKSSAVPAGPFRWRTRAEARITAWQRGAGFEFVVGEHDGFQRLTPPATVRREILFVHDAFWLLRDEVVSAAQPTFTAHFPLAPGVRVRLETDRARLFAPDDSGLLVAPVTAPVAVSLRASLRSSQFGAVEPAEILDVVVPHGIGTLLTVLVPFGPASGPPELEFKGTAVHIRRGGRHWEVVRGPVTQGPLRHDGSWGWLERGQDGRAISFGLIAGSWLEAGTERLISPSERGN